MKSKIWLFLVAFVIITALSVVIYNSSNNLENLPKKYCYDTLVGVLNYAFIVENSNEKDDLLKYYQKTEEWVNGGKKPGKGNIIIDFSMESLSMVKPVYVVDDSDSLFSKVITLYGAGHNSWQYIEGWVYKKTLHDAPPADTLLNKYLGTRGARHKLAK